MEIEDLNYIVINCTTRNEAIACCKLADTLGWKWCSEKSYAEQDLWEIYEEKTCYSFSRGEYCNLEYYEDMGYTVKSSEWFLDNFSIKENSSKLEDLYSMADSATKELLKTKFTKEELGIAPILPNTWEEFCEQNKVAKGEFYITGSSSIESTSSAHTRDSGRDKNLIKNAETAAAFLALIQLCQLRDRYCDGWVPDWTDPSAKYTIINKNGKVVGGTGTHCACVITLPTIELRDKFLNNFKDLLEIARELI